MVELVSKNPYADIHYTVREAVVVCIFNLCVLGEIGNSKSNVIAVSTGRDLQTCFAVKNFCMCCDIHIGIFGHMKVRCQLVNTVELQ